MRCGAIRFFWFGGGLDNKNSFGVGEWESGKVLGILFIHFIDFCQL